MNYNEQKNVSINDVVNSMEKALNIKNELNVSTVYFGVGDNKTAVTVRRFLTFKEKLRMINDICDMIFLGKDEVEFYAASKKFAIEYNIIRYFSNIDFGDMDVDDIEKSIENYNIYGIVTGHIDKEYLKRLIGDILDEVDYRKNMIYHRSSMDGVLSKLSSVIDEIKNYVNEFGVDGILNMLADDGNLGKFLDKVLKESADDIMAEIEEK